MGWLVSDQLAVITFTSSSRSLLFHFVSVERLYSSWPTPREYGYPLDSIVGLRTLFSIRILIICRIPWKTKTSEPKKVSGLRTKPIRPLSMGSTTRSAQRFFFFLKNQYSLFENIQSSTQDLQWLSAPEFDCGIRFFSTSRALDHLHLSFLLWTVERVVRIVRASDCILTALRGY